MSKVNVDLQQVYTRYQMRVGDSQIAGLDRFSAPLLLSASEAWENASQRVLLIGQETFGWNYCEADKIGERDVAYPRLRSIENMADFIDSEDAVTAMMLAYRRFSFTEHHSISRRSPFWRFYRDIRRVVGDDPSGFLTSVLWTNLCRQDYDCGAFHNAPDELRQHIRSMNKDVLREEISVLRPTDIIFCTGPRYDEELSLQFLGVMFSEVDSNIPQRQLASLDHPGFAGGRAWRVYHPAYMNRKQSSFGKILWERMLALISAPVEAGESHSTFSDK